MINNLKGQWFVRFRMNINGSAGWGERFNHEKITQFPLFADNDEDAKRQGVIFAQQLQNPSNKTIKLLIIPYHPLLREVDRFVFSDFSVYFEAEETKL